MRQPFRLLLTGSRTWDDTAVIGHALAAILARHPRECSWSTEPAPAEPTPSPRPTPPGHRTTASKRTRRTGAATAGPPGSSGTRR